VFLFDVQNISHFLCDILSVYSHGYCHFNQYVLPNSHSFVQTNVLRVECDNSHCKTLTQSSYTTSLCSYCSSRRKKWQDALKNTQRRKHFLVLSLRETIFNISYGVYEEYALIYCRKKLGNLKVLHIIFTIPSWPLPTFWYLSKILRRGFKITIIRQFVLIRNKHNLYCAGSRIL
jgi:hypothetical protein